MKRGLEVAARFFAYLAAIFLAGMMLVTVADVVLRSAFRTPVRGQFELVELALGWTVFLALPAVFLRDAHLVVDVADHFVSARLRQLLDIVGAVASVVALAIMLWQMAPQALYMMRFGDMTFDLQIPKLWYAAPALAGMFFSAIAAALLVIRNR
ncbi:MAG TPA: TRAP transporter small permease [Burkholderiales bacterium]|nr:TRAP transporter small permease [Burkholderiales bacterium]